jgi:hypothetical protein
MWRDTQLNTGQVPNFVSDNVFLHESFFIEAVKRAVLKGKPVDSDGCSVLSIGAYCLWGSPLTFGRQKEKPLWKPHDRHR